MLERLKRTCLVGGLYVFILLIALPSVSAQGNPAVSSCPPEKMEQGLVWWPSQHICHEGPQGEAIVKWKKEFSETTEDSTPAITLVGNVLYVRQPEDRLQAIAPDSGATLWELQASVSEYTVTNDAVVALIAGTDGQGARTIVSIDAVRPEHGSRIWSTPLDVVFYASRIVGVSDSAIYLGFRESYESARWEIGSYSLETGAELWRKSLTVHQEGTSVQAPYIDFDFQNNLLFVEYSTSATTLEILALDAVDGHTIWSVEVDANTQALPLGDAAILLRGKDGQTSALDFRSGEEVWTAQMPGSLAYATSERLYVLSRGNWLHAYDIGTGGELWRVEAGDLLGYGSILVFDGRLYVHLWNEQLIVSFDDATGQDRQVVLEQCDTGMLATHQGVICSPGFFSTVTPQGQIWGLEYPESGPDESQESAVIVVGNSKDDQEAIASFYTLPEAEEGHLVIGPDGVLFASYSNGIVAVGGDEGPHAIELSLHPPGQGIEVGSTVTVLNHDIVLRAAPAPSGVELAALPEETMMEVVGGPEENESGTWWQVHDTESGLTGFVPAESLAAFLD